MQSARQQAWKLRLPVELCIEQSNTLDHFRETHQWRKALPDNTCSAGISWATSAVHNLTPTTAPKQLGTRLLHVQLSLEQQVILLAVG